VIGDESEGGDCDEVICAGWGEPGGQWTEWGWRNEEGSWLHRYGGAYLKERLVICNEEDTDGRAIGYCETFYHVADVQCQVTQS